MRSDDDTTPGRETIATGTMTGPATGDPATRPGGLLSATALRLDDAHAETFVDNVVEETPVALLCNGLPFAVMMATPVDLEDFALGFALTEGIVEHAGEFRLVDRVDSAQGIALHSAIPQQRFEALEGRGRAFAGRSGCGLCGTESLAAAIRPVRRLADDSQVSVTAIEDGLQRLAQAQSLNRASGGVHAAGYVHASGILVREDVGRHNALDKLVGALACRDLGMGFLVITSRASYEIVHKAASAGIAVVVAMSAPTSLAIRLAEEAGVTLVAFARGRTMTVYTRADRIER
ncbi:MAG TPA: formate dehydrogenase accessory sulfurtransferase FdhD [Xanthomonadaceae bacterium]|jgi:formate dehydrogenase accessory protein FdhD